MTSKSSGCRSSCGRPRGRCSSRAATTSGPTGRGTSIDARASGVSRFDLPRYQPRSTLPLAACLWAGEREALRPFKHALYEAFFCEGEDIAADAELARAAAAHRARPGRRPLPQPMTRGRSGGSTTVREEAERAGVAGVPTLLLEDGRTHWGTGGVERLLAGEQLVPRG